MTGLLRIFAFAAALTGAASTLHAAPARPAQAPTGPWVVSTVPANGEKAADPGITTLEITFSEPMQANKYYLGPITGRDLPWEGMPPVVLSTDGRTFSVPISLKPNRKYGVAINAPGHMEFRSRAGKIAQPMKLFFNTAEKASEQGAPRAAAAPAPAVPERFHISAPADGSEVRDRVVVTVPASSVPEGAFVSFFVKDATKDTFVVGLAPEKGSDTLRFVWNTKEPLPGREPVEKRIPKDGRYTIRAELHIGQQKQTSEVTVTLRNTIHPAEAAEGFQLRYQFTPGQELEYYHQFQSQVKAPGSPQPQRHRGELFSRILVDEKLDSGQFVLLGRFRKALVDGADYTGSQLADKWNMSRSIRLELDPHGMMQIVTKKDHPLVEAVSQLIPLPTNRVKLNDPWTSSLVLPEVLKGKMAVAPAKHVAERVVWEGGQETLVIRSDYQIAGIKNPMASKHLILATGTTSLPSGGELTVRGRRYTFFAYKLGRVMRVTDQKTIRLVLTQAPNTGMGMPGAPSRPQRQVYNIEAQEVLEFAPPTETEE